MRGSVHHIGRAVMDTFGSFLFRASPARMRASAMIRRITFLASIVLLSSHATFAQAPDPCGMTARNAGGPAVQIWTETKIDRGWVPPACSGWMMIGARSLVEISGRLEIKGGSAGILERFGAISASIGVRYWSATTKRWKTLITGAYALDGTDHARGDFAPTEMLPGNTLHYFQSDNGAGASRYRLRVIAISSDRIVLTVENATTIRFLLLPLFGPGELQTLYVLERVSEAEWQYTSLTRTAVSASALTDAYTDSAINRSIAMFRHIAGIPTDQEPPAAP